MAVDVSANPNVALNRPASGVPAEMARVTGASGGGVTVRVASTGVIVWSGRPASVSTIVPPVMCKTRPRFGSPGGLSDGVRTGARTSSNAVPPGRQATVTVGPDQVNSPYSPSARASSRSVFEDVRVPPVETTLPSASVIVTPVYVTGENHPSDADSE